MAHPGQELEGPNGFKLTLIHTGEQTGGELLEMEASYPGNGQLPPEHFHPRQKECFEVLEGSIRAVVGGEERTYGAGESFEVPAGVPHQMTASEPARTRWEVRPALRTAEFFEQLYAAVLGGPEAAARVPEILAEYGEEFQLGSPEV